MPTTITPCIVLIGDLPDQVLALQDLVQDGEVVRIEDPRQVAASAQGKDIMHRPKEQLLFVVFDDGHPAPKRLSGLGYHVVLVTDKPGLESDPDGCLWVCSATVSIPELSQVIVDAGFGGLLPAALTAEQEYEPLSPSVEKTNIEETPSHTVADFLASAAMAEPAADDEDPDPAVSEEPAVGPLETPVGLGALMEAPLDPVAIQEPSAVSEEPAVGPSEASVGLGALMEAPLDPVALQEPPAVPEPTQTWQQPTIAQGNPAPSLNGHHGAAPAQPETLSLEALLGAGGPSAPPFAAAPVDGLLAPGLEGFNWGSPTQAIDALEPAVGEPLLPASELPPPPPPEAVNLPPPPPPPPEAVTAPPPPPAFVESSAPAGGVDTAPSMPTTTDGAVPGQFVTADEDAFVRDLLGVGEVPATALMPTPNDPQSADDLWAPHGGVSAMSARPQSATGYGKIIFTMVPKGGTGKTTFTAHAAAWAAQQLAPQGKSVALLDGNLQQGNILRLMGLPASSPTLFQIAREPVIDQEVVQRILLRSPRYPLDLVVPSNLATHRAEEIDPDLITPQLYRKVAQRLAETHNYVFVDTQVAEVHSDMIREFVLPTADFLMVVLDHDQSAADQTIPTLQLFSSPRWRPSGSTIDSTKMGIVLNRFNPASKLTQADLRAQLASWLWMGTVPFYQEWKDAADAGELWFGEDLIPRLNQILWHVTGDWAFRDTDDADQGGKKGKRRNGSRAKSANASSGRKWYSFLVPSKD
jgi:MinD-like ATPase involved in chromosome partitioning or flagellar assembly